MSAAQSTKITDKRCTWCGERKALDAFPVHCRQGRQRRSPVCRACAPAVGADYRRRMRASPALRERQRLKDRARNLVFNYGLPAEEYDRLSEAQGGVCAICGQPETATDRGGRPMMLHVDHCHRTGRIRGLLCHGCNSGLAGFRDDPALLAKAIAYLAR